MKHWSEETNWQRLGSAVQRLKHKVEAAYYQCDDETASAAHDDLVRAEWRQIQAERGMK